MLSSSQSLRASTFAARLSQVTRQFTTSTRTAYNGTQFTLNTGAKIPAIGFGTWQDKDAQEEAVLHALKAGYRHIDTASIYGTERAIGAAIKKSGIPRSEIFLTTKLWNNAHHPDDVASALAASLADLDTSYVDLYLMHWPSPFARGTSPFPKDSTGKVQPGNTDYIVTYRALEACQNAGTTRAIGVSNFSQHELKRLISSTTIHPAVHQIETHPYLQQRAFIEWHAHQNIHVTAYSPLGNQNAIYDAGAAIPKLISDPTLQDIAQRTGKSAAQVALAWGVARGCSVIPKSKTAGRIEENLGADFELKPEEVDGIKGLDKEMRFNDPSESFGWSFYEGLEGKK